jgi:lysophospholipase L1-like esterase
MDFCDGGLEGSSDEEADDMWEDDIHLSSAAHRAFADRLLKVFG